MSGIGDRIKLRRLALNMTQDELAKKLDYKSRASINKIELGFTDITQSKIADFANVLETTPSYLMGWSDSIENLENLKAQVEKLIDAERQIEKPSTVSDDGQRKIYEIVNQLTPENRDKLIEVSRLYLASQNKKKEN